MTPVELRHATVGYSDATVRGSVVARLRECPLLDVPADPHFAYLVVFSLTDQDSWEWFPPPLPHMRIHDLRHTCASLLLAMGSHPKVVQEVLGHSQISLTLDTYSHLIPGLGEEAANKIDTILSLDPVGVKVGVNQPESTPEAPAIA